MAVCDFFGLGAASSRTFVCSSELGIGGESTPRVLEVVRRFHGDVYVTGHGAQHYFDHELFESQGVRIEYMTYQKQPYLQQHGEFTPFVTILDLIANCGREGANAICSGTVPWREFLANTTTKP